MIRIISEAECCGGVALTINDVTIVIYPHQVRAEYHCPVCHMRTGQTLNRRQREALVDVGVVEATREPLSLWDRFRQSETRIVSTFQCQLDSVETLEDIGWTL